MQSYGTGNIPTNRDDLIQELRAATKRGVIIVNITQCATGCVSDSYESGKLLQEAGIAYLYKNTTIERSLFETCNNHLTWYF